MVISIIYIFAKKLDCLLSFSVL